MPDRQHDNRDAKITGRCYCGATLLSASKPPMIVSYCHCVDCRRWTGGPVAGFAAFAPDDLTITPALGAGRQHNPGVTRWNCGSCGSPIAAQFDYLPGQLYVSIGLLDQADLLKPQLHSHADQRLNWLDINDHLPRLHGSARDDLNGARS